MLTSALLGKPLEFEKQAKQECWFSIAWSINKNKFQKVIVNIFKVVMLFVKPFQNTSATAWDNFLNIP